MIALPPMTPLLCAARARLLGAPDIRSLADRRELCASEETRCPPATILEGRAARLRNFEFETEKARVFESLAGGIMRHRPSVAYTLREAQLLAGSVWAGGGRHFIRQLRDSWPGPAATRLDRVALCTSAAGDRYFGHFLTEDLPQVMIAGEFGEAVRWPDRNWDHLPLYRQAFELQWRECAAAHAARLTFFDDIAQNALRRRRYIELRRRLRAHVKPLNPGARVYLRRGATGAGAGARSPTNDGAVADTLRRRGFLVVDLENCPPTELIARLLDARIMVSVEGSQMIHGVYTLAENGAAGILMAPMRPVIQVKDRIDAIGLPTAIVVGEDLGDAFSIDLGDLERTLDLLEERLDQSASASASSPKLAAEKEAPAS